MGGLEEGGRREREPSSARYEVLGPLRAWLGDTEVDLGPAKQRAVLAVLLLNANKPVQTSTIIDAVWRDDPPANGANVVQKHIAGLRRVLEPKRPPRTVGELLTLTEAGYVLAVEPDSLDVDVVDSLLAQARSARDEGRYEQAAAHLRQAIDSWRSDALAGLTGAVFDAARERFTEIRAGALEAWSEVELTLGHHALIVPALADLVARFPVREKLRYLLILALYRCGRQAEALAAYREAHRFLDDEFGVAPGEGLTHLHQRILRADPELMMPVAPPVAPADLPPVAPPPASTPYPLAPVAPWAPPRSTFRQAIRVLGLIVALGIPLISIGFATWMVIGYYAARRRSPLLMFAATAYLTASLTSFVLIGGTDNATAEAIGFIILAILALGGLTQISILNTLRPEPIAVDPRLLEQRIRREQARQIMTAHPDIAVRLCIGRPHLVRTFDDGGLVDINVVPEQVLSIMLGLAPAHAHHIAADRYARGPFRTVDDLVARGLLDPHSVDRLREILVAGPPVGHGVPAAGPAMTTAR